MVTNQFLKSETAAELRSAEQTRAAVPTHSWRMLESGHVQEARKKNQTPSLRRGRRLDRRQTLYLSCPSRHSAIYKRAGLETRRQGGFGLHSESYIEAKGFHAHDGTSISLARLGGIKTGLITKRVSETVALRARDLKLEFVYQGIQDKLTVFEEIIKKEGIKSSEAAFVGDDVIDLPVMRNCGLAIAVANARDEVKEDAHYVTPHSGGDGALRDAVEYILKAQGKWKRVVEKYIGERSPGKAAIRKENSTHSGSVRN